MQLRQALEISLEYENKVRDHYRKGVEKIQDPIGRRIFTTLAKEEQGHVDFLNNRLECLKKPGTTPAPVVTVIPESWIVQAQKKMEKDPSDAVATQTDIELVKLALQLEHETSDFYRGLIGKLQTTEERRIFEPFIEIEDGHVAIVQAELDSLLGLGFWFDFQEFALEAG